MVAMSGWSTAAGGPPGGGFIILIGLMGAGKTKIGKLLAAKLDLPFFDSDREIETAAGSSIAEIFERFGEAYFRAGERRVIARLLNGPPAVMATGGGAFMDPETRQLIQRKGTSIWLRASIDLLVERTSRRDTRPLLHNGDAREILQKLADERHPAYALADVTVDVTGEPANRTMKKVLAAILANQAKPETVK
jgi:shikimate kinase